jgi:hypothetical protein
MHYYSRRAPVTRGVWFRAAKDAGIYIAGIRTLDIERIRLDINAPSVTVCKGAGNNLGSIHYLQGLVRMYLDIPPIAG